MIQAGVMPITWGVFGAELQRDWAREATVPAIGQNLIEHWGSVGTSLQWELQLLASAAGSPASPPDDGAGAPSPRSWAYEDRHGTDLRSRQQAPSR